MSNERSRPRLRSVSERRMEQSGPAPDTARSDADQEPDPLAHLRRTQRPKGEIWPTYLRLPLRTRQQMEAARVQLGKETMVQVVVEAVDLYMREHRLRVEGDPF